VRNVVAECLGRLAAQDPARLMPELRSRQGLILVMSSAQRQHCFRRWMVSVACDNIDRSELVSNWTQNGLLTQRCYVELSSERVSASGLRLDTSTDVETRATAVTAVKYAVLSAPAAALPAIAESLPAFLCAGTITVGAYTRSHFRST